MGREEGRQEVEGRGVRGHWGKGAGGIRGRVPQGMSAGGHWGRGQRLGGRGLWKGGVTLQLS